MLSIAAADGLADSGVSGLYGGGGEGIAAIENILAWQYFAKPNATLSQRLW